MKSVKYQIVLNLSSLIIKMQNAAEKSQSSKTAKTQARLWFSFAGKNRMKSKILGQNRS